MHAMTTTKEKTDIKPSTDGRTDANTVTVTVGGGVIAVCNVIKAPIVTLKERYHVWGFQLDLGLCGSSAWVPGYFWLDES